MTWRMKAVTNASIVGCMSNDDNTFAQESFHLIPPLLCVGYTRYLPSHTVSTIPCNSIYANETFLQGGSLFQIKENVIRGFGDGSGSSGNGVSSSEDERGGHNLISHYHSINPQHPLQGSARHKSLSTAINTSLIPQTSDGTSYISSKYPEGDIRDAVGTKPSIGTGFTLPKSSSVYTNKLEYLIGDCLTERGPILIDVPTG